MKVAQEESKVCPRFFELDFWNAENANYQNLVFSGYERSGQYTDHLQQINPVVRSIYNHPIQRADFYYH